jgi:hypothetical protein
MASLDSSLDIKPDLEIKNEIVCLVEFSDMELKSTVDQTVFFIDRNAMCRYSKYWFEILRSDKENCKKFEVAYDRLTISYILNKIYYQHCIAPLTTKVIELSNYWLMESDHFSIKADLIQFVRTCETEEQFNSIFIPSWKFTSNDSALLVEIVTNLTDNAILPTNPEILKLLAYFMVKYKTITSYDGKKYIESYFERK